MWRDDETAMSFPGTLIQAFSLNINEARATFGCDAGCVVGVG